jgi:small subunit ribosomal protein S2
MALPAFTMRQLLEAGVHFGHSTRRWNPKMAPYLFGIRNGIHIIDLQQTVPLLYQAIEAVRGIVASGGRVLFVGTKRQATERVAESAKRCGQYYVNHRWLGGMMTNWRTISNSIKRLRMVEDQLAEENAGLTKKEMLRLTREGGKLERALGGIKEMGGLPDILFVIDTNKEAIAVAEATKLGIPVVGVIDSNSNPAGIDFPIPGNDDAIRAIELYCEMMVGAVLDGIQEEMAATGADLGESEEAPVENLATAEVIEPAVNSETAPEPAKAEGAEPAPAEEQTAASSDGAEEPAPTEDAAAAAPPPVATEPDADAKTKASATEEASAEA